MDKKTTTLTLNEVVANVTAEASASNAGSPRKSTLEMIRRFARAYHYQAVAAIPVAMILN